MKILSCCAIAAAMSLVIGFSSTSYATSITVTNFSFENGSIDDWTQTGDSGTGSGAFSPNPATDIPPQEGTDVAYMQINNAKPVGTSLSITTSAAIDADPFSGGTTISAGLAYTLTVGVGARSGNEGHDLLIELLSDGTPFASATHFDIAGTIASDTFVDLSTAATAGTAGGVLSIRVTHTANALTTITASQAIVDNVRLEASVIPEPTAFALAAICLVGFGASRRRRR